VNPSSPPLQLIAPFLEATREEDPALAKSLEGLDERGRRQLAGVLGRFGGAQRHELHAVDRLLARRLLKPLRHRDADTLETLNKVLDYLDFDANGRLDEAEMDRCVEAIERFATLSPPDHQLSRIELDTLARVLRALDADSDHRLDAEERAELFEGMRDPVAWVARLQAEQRI
jgi:DNA topoisomerase VI subunit B